MQRFSVVLAGLMVSVAVCVAAAAAAYFLTREEPGFIGGSSPWTPSQFPISICVTTHGLGPDRPALTDDLVHADAVVDEVNERLGFFALRSAGPAPCGIHVTYEAPPSPPPSEWVQVDSGGYAVIGRGYCEIGLTNVTGEMKSLTLQHELGHCLGLAHDDDESSIMRPEQRTTIPGHTPARISDHDQALLWRAAHGEL